MANSTVASSTLASHRRYLAVVVVITLVLAGFAGGAWYLRGRTLPLLGIRTGLAGNYLGRSPDGPLRIAAQPGTSVNEAGVERFSQVIALNWLTSQELAAYRSGGADASRAAIYHLPDTTVLTVLVQLASHRSAITAMTRLTRLQQGYGLVPVAGPPGVATEMLPTTTSDGNWLIRAHYVHNDVVARIEVHGGDRARVVRAYRQAVGPEAKVLPPDV